MQPKTHVASFDLDHTRVRAPYVRRAGSYRGPHGDTVTKYDLRLVQPNRAEIPTAALHTIEHLLAGYLRDRLGAGARDRPQQGVDAATIVDASPMGCRTGFYLTVLGEPAEEAVRLALEGALRDISRHDGPIPGCSEVSCGNWRDHSLPGARAWAEAVLASDIIVQDTIPIEPAR